MVDGETRLSFGDLTDRSTQLATTLAAAGVGAGDTVSFQLPNRHETLLIYLACWHLGGIAVPIHARAGAGEGAALVERVGSTVHFHDRDHPRIPGVVNVDIDEVSVDEEAAVPDAGGDSADVAVILFTAGSSGQPKAVLHTHRTLGCKARAMVGVHGLTPDDVVLMPAPLAHVSGLLNGALLPWAAGMKTVLMRRWDTSHALDLIEAERVSFMVGPPTFFTGLLADPSFSADRVASLRLISSGGTGVTEQFARDTAERLACVVKRTYGSTEAPTVATTPAADHDDPRAVMTDGRPTPRTRLRVVDPQSGTGLPADNEGELQVSGPELFAGYLGPTTMTAEAMAGDWFRTGDLARLDRDGWLTITGRLKDVIIRAGENISPAEMTTVLERHPAVTKAVVTGVPDERLGERAAAFVVADESFDLASCRDWFESQGVARFKWPEQVERVDEIPLLPAGKPDVAALRKRVAT